MSSRSAARASHDDLRYRAPMTALEVVVLFAAAFVAGCVNAIAGGGTLISFPTLIWIGRDPIVANATNPLTRALRHAPREPVVSWRSGVVLFQLGVAVYGGYFGAGIGILMLASLGLSGFSDIHQMMALRNFAAVCINLVAAIYFVARGAV